MCTSREFYLFLSNVKQVSLSICHLVLRLNLPIPPSFLCLQTEWTFLSVLFVLPSGLLHLRLSVYRKKDPSGPSIAFMFSINKTKGMISILVLIQCTFPHYSQFVYMYAHSLCTALKGTPLLASGTVFWALVSQLTVFSVSGNANSIVCLSLLALPLLMPWGRS